ncbi:MAG TPA: sulfatase-like hydrolase/transferase [Phycisphaerae bacterium]|nr:sulfatase-like hydrolase/transferase [Phycisphaerae bacterium]
MNTMNRRRAGALLLLYTFSMPVAARAAGESAPAPEVRERPNVIFILADDWGWGDLGCYGHRLIRTPNLDQMSKEGIRFSQFYVCSGVCSPSRAAFMTGHFPARHAIHGHLATDKLNADRAMPNWLDPKITTITRLMQQAGYVTAHFGKWHLGSGPDAPLPTAYGIDVARTVNSNDPDGWNEGKEPYFRARSTRYIVDETINFIEEHRDRPFFVQAWTLQTHATLNPTEEQMKPFQRFSAANVPFKSPATIYYASAADADREFGRLLKKLDEMGLSENTIVIFSSDNGPEDISILNAAHSGVGSAGPFRGRKRSLYEGGVRVPFIIRWPGHIPAGKVDGTSVVAGVDFLPTICKLAGVPMPADLEIDGEDMSAAWLGTPRERTTPLMWEWRFGIAGHTINKSPILSIREGNWKLLMNPDRSRVELYDIPRDPSELNNLADKHKDVVERMTRRVLGWQKTLPKGPFDADAGSNAYSWAW